MRHALTPTLRLGTLAVAFLLGCSGKSEAPAPAATTSAAPAAPGGLTPFQIEHGIGPVTEVVTLGPVDAALAAAGKATFDSKCSACHKMTDKYVGPPLGDVTTRRSPAYVMNMLLNPEEMYDRHPAARQLLGEYMTQMPNLALSRDQAREVVEYLRTQAPK